MSDPLAFGPWLKQRRRALDLTQDDLARRAHCSAITIRKLESSDLTPSRSLARQLARVLDVPEPEQETFVAFARSPGASVPAMAFVRVAPAAPSTAPGGHRYRLPAHLTALVGRERDTLVGCRLLRLPGVRLLTLTGPPGAGKTRLSLEIAGALQDEFADGACFVPLAPLSDAQLVESAVAHALGVQESAQAALPAALRSYLGDKHVLLVFDNFEHVLSAAPLVTELLALAPKVKTLASSREPLRVYGEREWPVAPLAVPAVDRLPSPAALQSYAAVQLFVERAQAVRPAFALDEENAEAVARLCVLLDGLPLAIEMAAARVKWQSPQVVLSQLAEHLTLLGGEPRDRTPRQQTLRGAIDWSYDLLPEPERALLRQLSVFAGGFSAGAAAAVCGDEPAAAGTQALLLNLADKSLLSPDSEHEQRYTMLETIRQYARERLRDAREEDAARERHARYWMQFAEEVEPQLRGAGQVATLQRLGAEQDNLRAALRWSLEPAAGAERVETGLRLASALWFYWYMRGYQSEAAAYLRALLDRPGAAPHARALGLSALGFSEYMSGRFAEARQLLADARRLGPLFDDDAAKAWTLLWLANSAVELAEPDEAQALFEQSLALWRRLDDDWNIAYTLMFMGQLALQQADDERARALYAESAALLRALDDKTNLALPVRRLAQLALRHGDAAEAARGFAASLRLNMDVDDRRGIAACLVGLARVAALRGRQHDAARLVGYVDALLADAHSTLLGPDLLMRDELAGALSKQMDAHGLAGARDEGRALTFDAALVLADVG